ncbi:unnamed protein product [Strongylus vulgaris]|uniref:Uncharacterized protein n=1 Tax=Strongylus vulgaris TaxID=40348 RepID=A0A3P7LAN7_STRVU|nr:unnamed protein product [Strongylus vulgaris]
MLEERRRHHAVTVPLFQVGACALARIGNRQQFACVRVKPTSEDACKVDRRHDEVVVSRKFLAFFFFCFIRCIL